MKINKKHENNIQRKLTAPNKEKNWLCRYAMTVLAMAILVGLTAPAHAEGSDPVTVVNNLSDLIFALIKAVGGIIVGWGIVQVGLSVQSHDPSQRSNGILAALGGLIIFFAKEILTLISG